MNILFWIVLIIFVGIFISQRLPAKEIDNISIQQLKEMLQDKNKQFIDVRTAEEYRHNYIKGFKNFPLQHLSKNIDQLNPEQETILICQSGMRSLRAARALKKAGFHKIYNVKSGMSAWY